MIACDRARTHTHKDTCGTLNIVVQPHCVCVCVCECVCVCAIACNARAHTQTHTPIFWCLSSFSSDISLMAVDGIPVCVCVGGWVGGWVCARACVCVVLVHNTPRTLVLCFQSYFFQCDNFSCHSVFCLNKTGGGRLGCACVGCGI